MTFSVKAAFRYGWEAFRQRPGFFIASSLVYLAASFCIGVVSTIIDGALNGWPANVSVPDESLPGSIVDWGLSIFLSLGITAFYLKAFDAPATVGIGDLWHPRRFWTYLAVYLITAGAIALGLVLLIVPGILLGLIYLFGTFVVLDSDLGPINALEESRRITKGHRWHLLGLVLVLFLANVVGLLALGVGLLVSIPVTTLAFVYVYRLLLDAAGPSPYGRVGPEAGIREADG